MVERTGRVPRYFFHLYNDIVAIDEEGQELPDLAAARDEALRNARAIAADSVTKGKLSLKHRIDVADESGACVATVYFKDAVKVEGTPTE